jgi:hypothetical protein
MIALIGEHLTENGSLPSCPAQLVVESHLTLLEELWMGIEVEHHHRLQHNNPDSDVIAVMQDLIEMSRKRAGSNISQFSASRQPSPSKAQRRTVE